MLCFDDLLLLSLQADVRNRKTGKGRTRNDFKVQLDKCFFVLDIRQQLADQLRCLETRTDVETAILSEIQDYFKRRADIELDYSRNLEKLAKQITGRHKAEKQK